MTAISWKNPVNGDWSDASNWSTGTVPTSADDVTISVVGPYIVTISSADHASSLTFEGEAALFENAGSLTMAGALTVDGGFVSLNEANAIGSVAVAFGAVLAFGNAGALGAGTVSMSGGELLGTANETLGSALALSGRTTIAAAHGTTLNLTGDVSFVGSGNTVIIGAPGEDGEVAWSGTITSGNTLQLGTGAATGSIGGGAITDNGSLIIDNINAVTLTNSISGAGVLEQLGTGVTTINTRNAYSGGTFLSAGTLAIGDALALGSGTLTFNGGELLFSAPEMFFNNAITFSASGTTTTIAAAHGTTLTLISNVAYSGFNTVDIGAPEQDGDIVWSANPGGGTPAGGKFDVLDGTLTAALPSLADALSAMAGTTIAAGATLDWAGNFADINNLQGAGTVTNSGAAQTMDLDGDVNFSGTISGALSVGFIDDVSLSGLEDFTGGARVEVEVANSGTYDIVSNNGIAGTPLSSFVNDGLFEKTGGGGVSDVTSNFVNGGALEVLSGSLVFSGGFTNNGIVQGVLSESDGVWTVTASTSNAPPASTTADMIMRDGNNGNYEIYDLGNNAIQAAYALGLSATTYQVAGLGGFDGTNTSDLMLRSSTGAFEIEDISNNNVTGTVAMGQVGLEWQVAGFGDFSSRSESDMLMRNGGTGQFEIYDISNNAITSAAPMGQVGLEWSVAGFGDFSTRPGESDMLMRNNNTGAFELYDISNNQIISAAPMGQVGMEWSVAGFGDFSGNANETDMLMRNNNNGAFELYDIRNNAIVSAAPIGQVGLEWQVAGFGPINGADISDMVMRNSTTGTFEIYDITNSQLTGAAPMGQVGTEWSVAGIAVDPPGAAPANAQLVHAMASMGTSAPVSAGNIALIGAATSTQTLLTLPQAG